MKPLYEITDDYLFFVNQLDQADEITVEQLYELDQISDNLEQKIINVAAYIRNLEVEQESIENAIDSMAKRSHRLDKKVGKLKDYLKNNMEICNIQEIKSPYFDVKVKNNPPSIVIKDENLIPKEFFKEITMLKLDKITVSQLLKSNKVIPGIMLEKKTRIEIK